MSLANEASSVHEECNCEMLQDLCNVPHVTLSDSQRDAARRAQNYSVFPVPKRQSDLLASPVTWQRHVTSHLAIRHLNVRDVQVVKDVKHWNVCAGPSCKCCASPAINQSGMQWPASFSQAKQLCHAKHCFDRVPQSLKDFQSNLPTALQGAH